MTNIIGGPIRNEAVVEELSSLSSSPLSLSPNELYVAWTASAPGLPYGIEIREISTGSVKERFFSKEPIRHVLWNPRKNMLCYFRQDAQTFRHLVVWDLGTGVHKEVPTMSTRNQSQIRWSPDGEMIAFTSDATALCVVRLNGSFFSVSAPVISFAWNQESTQIVTITKENPNGNKVFVIDGMTGARGRDLEIGSISNLVSVEWNPNASPLLRGQTADKLKSHLFWLDTNQKCVTRSVEVKGEVSDPLYVPGGEKILWATQSEGDWRRLVIGDSDATVLRSINLNGNANFRSFSSDGHYVVASVVSPANKALIKIDLRESSDVPILLGASPALPGGDVLHESVEIPSDGARAKIFISRLINPKRRANAAVVRMLGGSKPQYEANWAETQLYLRHGFEYISVPNRADSGTIDLLNACKYVSDELKIDKHRIVVYGASTAATLALEAAIIAPDNFGTLVVVGLVAPPRLSHSLDVTSKLRILAFHGAYDPRPFASAKAILDRYVGDLATQPPRGMWHVFPGEAHSLSVSDGIVHSTILHYLGQ